ncbi:hypothetical protein ACTXT7_006771 [Hymenolepis weldensis]
MPPQWVKLLKTSNIPTSEQAANPDLMLDVLQCYDESAKSKEKYMTNISGVTSKCALPACFRSLCHSVVTSLLPLLPSKRVCVISASPSHFLWSPSLLE